MAVCQRSANADLESLLRSVFDLHDVTDDRFLLVTPRPDFARNCLQQLTADVFADRIDLTSHTTIIRADEATLKTVFVPHESGSVPRQSARTSSAGPTASETAVTSEQQEVPA